jgi:hypothetical protein
MCRPPSIPANAPELLLLIAATFVSFVSDIRALRPRGCHPKVTGCVRSDRFRSVARSSASRIESVQKSVKKLGSQKTKRRKKRAVAMVMRQSPTQDLTRIDEAKSCWFLEAARNTKSNRSVLDFICF